MQRAGKSAPLHPLTSGDDYARFVKMNDRHQEDEAA
jgi:hypothetical protein